MTRRVRDTARAATRGSAAFPRRADWRCCKAPSSRSPAQSIRAQRALEAQQRADVAGHTDPGSPTAAPDDRRPHDAPRAPRAPPAETCGADRRAAPRTLSPRHRSRRASPPITMRMTRDFRRPRSRSAPAYSNSAGAQAPEPQAAAPGAARRKPAGTATACRARSACHRDRTGATA